MLINAISLPDCFILYGIKYLPNHFITDNGILQISHCPRKRTLPTKFLSVINNGERKDCKGVKIDGRFYSLTSLNKRKYPITKVIVNVECECPF